MRAIWRCLGIAATVTACAEVPTEEVAPPAPTFAAGRTDTGGSRAHLVWADVVNVAPAGAAPDQQPAGIQGDNRNRFGLSGTGVTDEYQGAFCGVTAFIWNGARESGTLRIDPDAGYTTSLTASCGPVRFFHFYLAGTTAAPTPIGAKTDVTAIWALGPGASVLQGLWFANQGALSDCKLWFDDAFPPANHVRVTRLPDVGGARQWRVESQGTHRASCTVPDRKGNPVPTGTSYYLPFSVTITEVPYPYPTFP